MYLRSLLSKHFWHVILFFFQSQEESYPDLETDIIEATDIPEVETEVILMREPSRDDITIGKIVQRLYQ